MAYSTRRHPSYTVPVCSLLLTKLLVRMNELRVEPIQAASQQYYYCKLCFYIGLFNCCVYGTWFTYHLDTSSLHSWHCSTQYHLVQSQFFGQFLLEWPRKPRVVSTCMVTGRRYLLTMSPSKFGLRSGIVLYDCPWEPNIAKESGIILSQNLSVCKPPLGSVFW